MNEFDYIDTFNDNPQHDGWVDFNYIENTVELSGLLVAPGLNDFINKLNPFD